MAAMRTYLWVGLLVSLLVSLSQSQLALAQDRLLDASLAGQPSVSLTGYFASLEDASTALTLDEVRSPAIAPRFETSAPSAAAINHGLTRSAYWLRLTLTNPTDQPLARMLQIDYPILSSVRFFSPLADGGYRLVDTGNAQPFDTRGYANRGFVFPLALPPHAEQTYYLRVQSLTPLIVPATLWEPSAFHHHERNDYLAQSWYFGMATAMILFNLLLFIALRDSIYLLYVTFAVSTVLAFSAEYGMAKEFLWPETTFWADISSGVFLSLAVANGLLFMRRMLDTTRNLPKLDRLFKALIALFFLAPLGFFFSLRALIPPTIALIGLTMLLVLATSLYCAVVKRQRSAIFFALAFSMLLLGAAVLVMRGLGLLPTNLLTAYGVEYGSALEMLLLALALADRFNTLRREKAAAQQHLVEHLQSHERVLEARVLQRTEELKAANERLETLSVTDALTGIANRRRFDEVLASEWSRAARAGHPLAVALLDIDWFKRYNDHYGHPAGDECLRRVAAVLRDQVCRIGDLVARYGGEEFAFIAPASNGEDALAIARRICLALENLALSHQPSEFGCVSCSIGVAALTPAEGRSPDQLVKAADEALYRAKEQGRNRAVLAEA